MSYSGFNYYQLQQDQPQQALLYPPAAAAAVSAHHQGQQPVFAPYASFAPVVDDKQPHPHQQQQFHSYNYQQTAMAPAPPQPLQMAGGGAQSYEPWQPAAASATVPLALGNAAPDDKSLKRDVTLAIVLTALSVLFALGGVFHVLLCLLSLVCQIVLVGLFRRHASRQLRLFAKWAIAGIVVNVGIKLLQLVVAVVVAAYMVGEMRDALVHMRLASFAP